ncbi:hypothetical protein VTJ83DRAFT_2138 [Remersonia thermophila]|uniref:tRNA (guanine(37)-N1)-methyltransferase n=1 Tax=Remersonia thermophila TaxID=72144 RepID=A0ABR4DK64_9PEZI
MSHPESPYHAEGDMTVFQVPIVRTGTAALNRALFSKSIGIAAAAVHDNKTIAHYRKALQASKEILQADRVSPICPHPDKALAEQGRKCLLLTPGVKAEAPDTWGPVLKDGVQKKDLSVMPYELKLDYDYWSYRDVMLSILPEDLHDEIPSGFNIAGHVAHLNLRDAYVPYKQLIAEILLDKNPQIRTVINKVDNVGAESEFRTFQYEVLAGPDDMQVTVNEGDCTFEFDYSKVYWNSKLETEHRRLVTLFRPGEVVCDVMAGIGPFAVPAGKKRVFVWANDKNPESFKCLEAAIQRNKVAPFVRPFCEDGHAFIRRAADDVLEASRRGECAVLPAKVKPPRRGGKNNNNNNSSSSSSSSRSSKPSSSSQPQAQPQAPAQEERIPIPPTISHFVMNLPASAIDFLPSYRGLYAGHEDLFAPGAGGRLLPMVHVHCFGPKADDDGPKLDVCERVSKALGARVRLAKEGEEEGREETVGEDGLPEVAASVHLVRAVAPAKSMYCASFRLPRAVAFAPRE